MKTQRYGIFGCFLLIGAIVVSVGFALADANAGFGKTITTAQMANMFGGGIVWGCDTDCDTTSGSCPGGGTCEPDQTGGGCYSCKTGNGQICGTPNGWPGWQCVNDTESCDDEKGLCTDGSCERRANSQSSPSCGTRPDC